MGIAEFYKSLSLIESKECIEKFLLYNASLVVAGVKPSETLTIKKHLSNLYNNWLSDGSSFLNQIGLSFLNLRENDDALIILVYNHDLLQNTLFQENNMEFLKWLGYPSNDNLRLYLETLKNRYYKFNCPHELGIFLGIPLMDVKDFIECSNKKCLGCGYWKVYNNYEDAKKIFDKYDSVKEQALNCLIIGGCSLNLALDIRKGINIA